LEGNNPAVDDLFWVERLTGIASHNCFPKDLYGMIDFMTRNGIRPDTLYGAWLTNLQVRPERDWEELKGRAVE